MSSKVWVADRWKGAKTGPGLRWRVVWVDPDSKRERSRSFAKKADAEAFRTKTEHTLRSGVYVSAEVAALTVGDAAEAWMSGKKKPKGASLGRYRDALDNHVLPRWGDTLLASVKRQDVDSWVSALVDGTAPRREGLRATGGGMAPASVQAIVGRLNSALLYAVDEGWLRKNPAAGVEIPKVKGDPVVFLTYPELEALISAAREHGTASDAALIGVLGNVGLRPGEASVLTVGDVNLTKRRISVTKTATVDAGGRSIVGTTPKTDAGVRDVPIPPHLVSELADLIGARPADASLFTSPTGEQLNLANWRNRQWKTFTTAAGTPAGLSPKGLRHTAASLAIGAGADVLVVQRMLGHASATETLNTYAKLWPDRLDEVTAAMTAARNKAVQVP